MKTFITISAILLASCFNAQSHFKAKKLNKREKELYEILKKTGNHESKELDYPMIKFYACMEKHYKLNPLDYYEFKTEEQRKNEFGETIDLIKILEKHSFHFYTYGLLDYQKRIDNQKAHRKCIKKSDIDW